MKTCVNCLQRFSVAKYPQRKFCSRKCGSDHYRKISGMASSGLPTGTTGAIGELLVCCDLLRKGYEVFRSVTPTCSCDLAILKEGKLLRIEVRTAYLNKVTGHVRWAKPKKDRFDVLALIVNDKEITYEPKL